MKSTSQPAQPPETDVLAITGPLEDRITISIPFVGPLFYNIRRIAKRFGIRVVPKSTTTIFSSLGSPKAQLPVVQRSEIVYGILCSCGDLYVGQTGRELQDRLSEHENSWKKNSRAFSAHSQPGHLPDFKNAQILASEKSAEIREVKEAMLILQGGDICIENLNIGQRSGVNRNRGKDLDPHWIQVAKRFLPLPGLPV